MAKFNIAILTDCPEINVIKAAFSSFNESEKFVVMDIDVQSGQVYATLVVDSEMSIPQLDRDKKAMETQTVNKSKMYPFRIERREDGSGILQTYAGSGAAFKLFVAFFQECFEGFGPISAQEIEIEPLTLFEKILEKTKTKVKDRKGREIEIVAKIKKAKFLNYEANSEVKGVFNAQFKNSAEAREFIDTFHENFKSITIEYGHRKTRVRMTYGATANFSISSGSDVGEDAPRWLLEDLITVPAATPEQTQEV